MSFGSIQYIDENRLREIAKEFLQENHRANTIPVPIEYIVEYNLHLHIVPVPSLMLDFSVDGFLTKDLTELRVDRGIYLRGGHRYRFTLAHESAHLYLHTRIINEMSFSNVSEWKQSLSTIPEKLYSSLEWQANAMAGLVLVPESYLGPVNV